VPFVNVGRENGADIAIHHNDHGAGPPVSAALLDLLGGETAAATNGHGAVAST
jgi:hypothetical protein